MLPLIEVQSYQPIYTFQFLEKTHDKRFSNISLNKHERVKTELSEIHTLEESTFCDHESTDVKNLDISQMKNNEGSLQATNRLSEIKQKVVTLYNCKHSFHKPCLEKWINRSDSCPM